MLCQWRTEPAMRGILDTATDAGLRALDVCRYTTDAWLLRRKLNGLLRPSK